MLIVFKGILPNSPCASLPSRTCRALWFSLFATHEKTFPKKRKNHPKLYLHNVALYNTGFFSGVPKALVYAFSYIMTLCKIAARPALAQGKKGFPFHPFRAVFFACHCPLPAKNTARRAGHRVRYSLALKQGAWPQA